LRNATPTLLHLIAGESRLQVVRLLVHRSAETGEDDALAVQRHFEVVGQLEAADDVDRLAIEPRTDHVLPIRREVMPDQDPAASPDGQARDVVVLREIASHSEGFERWRHPRARHGQTADFPRRRQISFHQRRRDVQHGRVIVEAVRLFVGGKQRRHIDLESEHVADSVAVFAPVQPVHRRLAKHRRRKRARVDRRFEMRDQSIERLLGGARHPGRGHHPGAHLPNHLLPDVAVTCDVRERDGVEREPASLQALVVACHAVLIHQRGVGRRWGGLNRRSLRRGRRLADSSQHCDNPAGESDAYASAHRSKGQH
jgi:hypothetical protein